MQRIMNSGLLVPDGGVEERSSPASIYTSSTVRRSKMPAIQPSDFLSLPSVPRKSQRDLQLFSG